MNQKQKQNQTHPGQQLMKEFLGPLGITPETFSSSLGLPLDEVMLVLQGKGPITHDLACRLALYFRVPVLWWLEMQARYDAEDRNLLDTLRGIVKPCEQLTEVLVTPSGVRFLSGETTPTPKVELHTIPQGLVERLKAQVALNPPRAERIVEQVEYDNGAKALIGRDS